MALEWRNFHRIISRGVVSAGGQEGVVPMKMQRMNLYRMCTISEQPFHVYHYGTTVPYVPFRNRVPFPVFPEGKFGTAVSKEQTGKC